MKTGFLKSCLVLCSVLLLAGCRTYEFRMLQPQARVLAKDPCALRLDPLDYELSRRGDQVELRIRNTTDDRILLLGDRSFVVDPTGESHPLQGRVLAPRSFTTLRLPPTPELVPAGVALSPQVGLYPAPAYAWPFGYGYNGFVYGDFSYAPTLQYSRVVTPFDWDWQSGPARLRLAYEREGNTFEHEFEFVRDRIR